MLELSHSIRHPSEYRLATASLSSLLLLGVSPFVCVCLCAVVPLKHGLSYEVLEKGHVRFWLQAVKLSPSVSYRFIVNDKEVTSGEVTSPTFIILSTKKTFHFQYNVNSPVA